ncbi:ABC transporter permease [Alicyclobacillus fastidiosus]|uniref:Autoinducer 2 import system permease protein LsrD n=1 Tax=Alicyclobacillus fastidiosus TaxID=392011 RepID=A0ABY6ZQM7_9BACL|nr:ABC transporter permease [Alicyclobacillus fastidiosus]WAH44399.1 ABC transporter permease [Alicyclobacillus fastidiosus]GMA60737.1 ribose ABC transporter permease [Alicyclobacillus fastidiosus]
MIRNQNQASKWPRRLNENRIYVIFVLVFAVMAIFAPRFLTPYNMGTLLQGMTLDSICAVGFTIVLIMGQLDLSIGSNITMGAMFVIGFQPSLGWTLSLIIALLAGSLVGLINGLLVAKAKIHSFIVTLGTMTIVQGVVYLYANGSDVNTNAFGFGNWLTQSIPIISPYVLIGLVLVVIFEVVMRKTLFGRGLYMIGGNRETAWLSGQHVNKSLILGFVISGFTSALAGALFAISLGSATPTLGTGSEMEVIAATIIGGTSMAGGEGSVLKSVIAVLALTVLFNGLSLFYAPNSVQQMCSGLVLAIVVLQESYSLYRRERVNGIRPHLLQELSKSVLFNNK